MGMGLPIGGGIGGIVLLLIISALTGINPTDLINTTSAPSDQTVGTSGVRDDDPQAQFVSVVLKDTEDTWTEVLRGRGRSYEPPTLVLFTQATQTGCGVGQDVMGPFYCPNDRKVYLDLSFFRDLDARFGAPGDFAEAYVIAHEFGHHVQTLLGTEERVREEQQQHPSEENELSVRLELQADCYAGVWGHSAYQNNELSDGDVEEALAAAASVGDDRIQRSAGQRVNPETWTHGSSAQRRQWFKAGYESGDPGACDTFSGSI